MDTIKEIRKILPKTSRDRIIKVFEGFEEKKEKFLILELMTGNIKNQIIQQTDIYSILWDIGLALRGMHQKGFAHLDIRPGETKKKIFYSEK